MIMRHMIRDHFHSHPFKQIISEKNGIVLEENLCPTMFEMKEKSSSSICILILLFQHLFNVHNHGQGPYRHYNPL